MKYSCKNYAQYYNTVSLREKIRLLPIHFRNVAHKVIIFVAIGQGVCLRTTIVTTCITLPGDWERIMTVFTRDISLINKIYFIHFTSMPTIFTRYAF